MIFGLPLIDVLYVLLGLVILADIALFIVDRCWYKKHPNYKPKRTI